MSAQVGPFEVGARLGRGGMGVVHRARHRDSGRIVALKTIDATDDPALIEGIRREIHALARLDHPGIVRIVEHGLQDGVPWYAMEVVPGRPLRDAAASWGADRGIDAAVAFTVPFHDDAIRSWWTVNLATPQRLGAGAPAPGSAAGPADVQAAMTVVRRLCSPLAYLHGEGIVHRDLKPDNVLVRLDGRPVILDFGLMTPFSAGVARDSIAMDAAAVGTVDYVAPEQAEGALVDARADVYSLGCILYELLAGQPPFSGGSPHEALVRRFREDPLPPRELVPSLSPELDALVMAMLARAPAERIGHASDVARILGELGAEGPPDEEPAARSYLYRPGFVGRDAAIAELEERLDGVRDGAGGVTVVLGESGVGKTRLALAAASRAAALGMAVFRGESEGGVGRGDGGGPLHAIRPALRAVADRCRADPALAAALLGSRAALLGLYEPAIAALAPSGAEPPVPLPPAAARLRLFRALAETFEAIGQEQPLLLVVDDVQWADDLTLEFLAFAARGASRGGAASFGAIATCRSEESGGAERLLRAPGVARVELGRLGAAEIGAMAAEMLALREAPATLVSYLVRHSQGNPFFVAEYLRTALAAELLRRGSRGEWQVGGASAEVARWELLPLPTSIRELVTRRLSGLSPDACSLLATAAVLGREVALDVLVAAAASEESARREATRELLARQVLEESGPAALRFAHDKLREVAYERVPAGERPARHRAAAAALEALPADRRADAVAAIARHWELAGEPGSARSRYLEAARAALGRYAHRDAEPLFASAVALFPPGDAEALAVRFEVAEKVLRVAGRTREAEESMRALLLEVRRAPDVELEVRLLTALSMIARLTGRMEEASSIARAAGDLARGAGQRRLEANALSALGSSISQQGRAAEGRACHERAIGIARSLGLEALEVTELGNIANVVYESGNLRESRPIYEEVLRRARALGDRRLTSTALGSLANCLAFLGEAGEAAALQREALALRRELGDRRAEGVALGDLASLEQTLGGIDRARSLYLEALDVAREVGDQRYEAVALANLGALEHQDGRLEESMVHYAAALAGARSMGDPRSEGIWVGGKGDVLRSLGRFEESRQLLAESFALLERVGERRYQALAVFALARLDADQGALDAALATGGRAIRLLSRTGNVELLAHAHLWRAALLRRRGARRDLVARAVGRAGRLVLPEDAHGRVLLSCARGHLALASGRDAASWLEAARAAGREMGPRSVGHEAIRELEREMGRGASGSIVPQGGR